MKRNKVFLHRSFLVVALVHLGFIGLIVFLVKPVKREEGQVAWLETGSFAPPAAEGREAPSLKKEESRAEELAIDTEKNAAPESPASSPTEPPLQTPEPLPLPSSEPPPQTPEPTLPSPETAAPVANAEIAVAAAPTPVPTAPPPATPKPQPRETPKPKPKAIPKPKPKATPKPKPKVTPKQVPPMRPNVKEREEKERPNPTPKKRSESHSSHHTSTEGTKKNIKSSSAKLATKSSAKKEGSDHGGTDLKRAFLNSKKGGGNGSEQSGSDSGTQGEGVNAGVLAGYHELIHDRFYSQWEQPTAIPTEHKHDFVCTLQLTIERNGTISNFSLAKPSGNPVMDQSVLAAAARVTQIAPLPEGLNQNSSYTVNINFELE
jgi:TonB family protein